MAWLSLIRRSVIFFNEDGCSIEDRVFLALQCGFFYTCQENFADFVDELLRIVRLLHAFVLHETYQFLPIWRPVFPPILIVRI